MGERGGDGLGVRGAQREVDVPPFLQRAGGGSARGVSGGGSGGGGAARVQGGRRRRRWRRARACLRVESAQLVFPLNDQSEGDGLDAAGRLAPGELLPQHRRHREADEVVDGLARLLRRHELSINLARRRQRLGHRARRHLAERDPPELRPLRHVGLEQLAHVRRDRLALAVGVGREVHRARARRRLPQRRQRPLRPRVDLEVHREAALGLHRALARREDAHVPVAREHVVPLADDLRDRLALRRRLDHQQRRPGRLAASERRRRAARFTAARGAAVAARRTTPPPRAARAAPSSAAHLGPRAASAALSCGRHLRRRARAYRRGGPFARVRRARAGREAAGEDEAHILSLSDG